MEQAIFEIEKLCQEKLLAFHELLDICRSERTSIIKADVGALWEFTRAKQKKADRINEIRIRIIDTLDSSSIKHDQDLDTFSLNKIISILPRHSKTHLVHIKNGLVGVKTLISAISRENKLYLDESLSTIEDLVNIIAGNCSKNEVYNRAEYVNGHSNMGSGIQAYRRG